MTVLWEGLTRKTLGKTTAWHDSSTSNHVLFRCLASRELLTKSIDLQISLSLHQLNTKPNTIKSHKIQGTKLEPLQHFLSWNKANKKHSCKSQLYKNNHILVVDNNISHHHGTSLFSTRIFTFHSSEYFSTKLLSRLQA